ncbi:hypothetical protein AGMMS50229_19980 [Campylobacterota bacterium]|nr:hypothetical protein AGMMS50229_19980 [Campylobacterota bacterium]
MELVVEAASFKRSSNYHTNLQRLEEALRQSRADLVAFGEVCLTGFDYDHFDEAASFAVTAHAKLLELSKVRAFGLTVIEKRDEHFFNVFKLYDRAEVVFERTKHKLFFAGNEHLRFAQGDVSALELFEWRGWKLGVLICFEIRFADLWLELNGAELILIPAAWDASRKKTLKALSKALAIVNRAFVLTANSQPNTNNYLFLPSGARAKSCAAITQSAIEEIKNGIPYAAA